MLLSLLRLVIAVGLFLVSLMVVVPATHVVLWYTVIIVTELGHWFSLASLGIVVWELIAQRRHPNFYTLALGVMSLALFLKPLAQATVIARKLPGQLAAAFGERGRGPGLPAAPLSDAQLWGLTPGPKAHARDFSFTARNGTALPLRLYTDGIAGPQPIIIIVHGGGWKAGNEVQLVEWNIKLASIGFRVAAISYRFAPHFPWPAQKEDLAAAIAFLKAHAGEMGIDPTRIALLGRSAGGQIALDAAYTLRDPAIRGCIASYAPTDMNFAYWTGKEDDMLGSRPLVRSLMGGPPASNPALYHDASPLDFVGPDTPPTLLVHGGRDEIVWVRHSERLRDRMVQAGRPVYLLELPWATHGFDAIPRGPGTQLEFYAMAWFLNAVLRGP